MIAIILGIKDYICDYYHDLINPNDYSWIEGKLTHYIKQRKMSIKYGIKKI